MSVGGKDDRPGSGTGTMEVSMEGRSGRGLIVVKGPEVKEGIGRPLRVEMEIRESQKD